MLRKILSPLAAFLLCTSALHSVWAQVDSTDETFNRALEDLIQTTDAGGDVDYTFITDQLDEFRRRKLNLNTAAPAQLRALPGITDLHIAALARHIARYGKLLSIFELQAVQGWDEKTIHAVQPYVGIGDLAMLRGTWRTDFTQRQAFTAEPQRGYSTPNPELGDTTRYAGSSTYAYTRVRARYGNNISIALTGEKDKGETMRWNPQRNQFGYDFASAHVALQNYGRIESLVVGDYTIQAGQGMVLSRGLGFGKGSGAVTTVKQPNVGIRPYSSVNEALYLRGFATTIRVFKNLHATAFASRTARDASVTDVADSTNSETVTNDDGQTSSDLQLSGLHRTRSEIKNRKTVMETLVGGRIEYKTGVLTVGTTHYLQRFDLSLNKSLTYYNQFDFRGNTNYLNSVDIDAIFQNFNFFGEVARSKSGGIGAVGGFLASLNRTLDVTMVARNYDKEFHTSHAFAFAERPTTLQNERGLYTGVLVKPTRQWSISGYLDQYAFAQPRFGVYYPSHGHEFLAQVEYIPRRNTSVYMRFRSDNKEENVATAEAESQIRYLVPTQRDNFRVHFRTKVSDKVQLATRAEWTWFRKDTARQRGVMVYQDVVYRLGMQAKLTARYAVFNAPGFDARIYAYENDVLGAFSIPPYYGIGSRYYIMLTAKPVEHVEIWLRVAQTRYTAGSIDRNSDPNTNRYAPQYVLGSGLEEIRGLSRTDIKLQIRVSF